MIDLHSNLTTIKNFAQLTEMSTLARTSILMSDLFMYVILTSHI